MTNSDWSHWDGCHSEQAQLDRQERAAQKKLTPRELNVENCFAVFKGSGSNFYETDLLECTCTDFRRRTLPCKHMYRLAYELHLFDLGSPVEQAEVPLLDKKEAFILVETCLTVDEQKLFCDFCFDCGNNNSGQALLSGEFADKLLSCKLAVEVEDIKILLSYLRMQDIRKNFLPADAKSPKTKNALIDLVSPYVHKKDIVFNEERMCLTLHPQIAHLGHIIHRHLRALYPREDIYFSY